MTAEGDTYLVTQSGPPLTLGEVREIGEVQKAVTRWMHQQIANGVPIAAADGFVGNLCATIEWLVERIRHLFVDSNNYTLEQLAEDERVLVDWLRGEA